MDESTTGDDLLAALGRPYRPLLERFGSRHAELLRGVAAASPVRLVAEPCGDGRWTVSIAALDAVGVLVVIAGVFAGRRIDIRNGDVFSLRPKPAAPSASSRPGPRSPRRQAQPPRGNRGGRILDIFEVETSAHVDAAFWKDVEQELAALVSLLAQGEATAAIERVALGVSESVAGLTQGEDPLLPISVTLENHDDATATELRLHASDTPAFLFEFASALTLLDVDIERVRIRTLYGDAQNTFWVTDANGSKIEDPTRIQELRVATALIKQFSHLLPRSANPAQALQQFTKLASDTLRRPDWTATLESLGSGDVLRTLADMMGVSSFLWEDFLRLQHENLFPILSDIPGLEVAKDRAQLGREFASELEGSDGDEAKRALNGCKDREMFRIDLRHVTRRIDLEDFSAELTDLAEATVAAAADLCWRALRARHGTPTWPWCVCGAGKLGGRELGYASDIELVFVCDPDAESDADSKIVFAAFAQQFLKTLEARQNGVFEIDLRLRPFGESGPLTSTLETFRSYYRAEGQAHQFERLSLVKLRPIAGDRDLGKRIEAVRDGFVYSGEPIDLDNIRHLRERQARELVQPGTINAKYSPGGLVDVEYFIQSRQIELGASHLELRTTSTHDAVARLANLGALEARLAERITESYRFLRRLIDALRAVRGRAKDVTVPAASTREFDYLTRRLGYGSPEGLARDVERWMAVARDLWS
jgi:glutamate-ammonia-ligase adenylyltransferase